jgi:hypothetical protein
MNPHPEAPEQGAFAKALHAIFAEARPNRSAELETALQRLESAMVARERAIAESESRLAARARDLDEMEALLLAREKLLRAKNESRRE